ncbi:tRNA (N6-isopentenyl adenosine(37)-C2)-methylthiotransferase MiaB [Alkalicella caledoniensis]|uniref:tRNA-2-methylthio-N(6)-dimethylallyladenosine synthase n=1 Tax=Alkalicella caledoniensis TaxID=2731377 RepID=A0A7G9WCU9_ALKCA|nr:tRNA (N6-isopentenyl adenosine(37)-C2)-methylthiotransferase MiaB [Alkalicella caledoniensis]QNO16511.1 tRNA (N6-isopentenyl adenosine(37)-C2)-methylthiotransferase MiaB [Alkalicella caledoniensis]
MEVENKHFIIHTYGCQMNVHDSEILAGMLGQMGYSQTSKEEEADIILINTCTIRDKAEQKVFGKLGALKKLKEEKPNLIVGICGCMSQQEEVAEKIKKSYRHVDLLFGTHNVHQLPEMIKKILFNNERVFEIWEKEGEVVEGLPQQRNEGVSAWVTITYGCNNFCTYCIVPYVRGRERSRKPEDIVEETKRLASEGFKEITLLGQNVNSYGKDFDESYDFADLIKDLDDIEGIERIRYMTSHPRDFTDKLVDVIANSKKVCNHFHLPVQAGSNTVLKKMNRGYTREEYLELVGKIKKSMGHVAITTDLIVGFPGETEEDFQATLDLVSQVRFDSAFTFAYSPRTGTPAAKMEEQVRKEDKSRRLTALIDLQNQISKEINEGSYLGNTFTVLVEGPSKNNPDFLSGRTTTNKLVNFSAPSNESLVGQIVKVKIIEAQTWSLLGEVVL